MYYWANSGKILIFFWFFRARVKNGINTVCIGLDSDECTQEHSDASVLPGLRIKNGIQVHLFYFIFTYPFSYQSIYIVVWRCKWPRFSHFNGK